MRRSATTLLAITLLLLWASSGLAAPQQERRTALVIGNSAYASAPLKNPVNDARDMAAALRGLGFEVILRENASLAQMEGAVNEFWGKLKGGGAGLFYFAGHGLQVNGRNYLVPVDARLSVEQDARYKCMDAGLVLGRMEDAGNGLNIVILDACRNNPFARSWRSADVGLAKMDAPKGSIIAYATAPDSVAADGQGKNGLYTEKLLRAMRAPGQPVEQMFKRVRDEVMRATTDKQVPWESTSLRGDFYFSPGAGAPALPAAAAQPVALPSSSAHSASTQLAMGSTPNETPKAAPPTPADEPKVGDTWTEPVTGMEFMWVPGGEYEMGCGPWASECFDSEKPAHAVRVSGFWLGKYEVTQGQWKRLMGANPSLFQKGDNYPVEQVLWGRAKAYIDQLNRSGSGTYRLPTEAEWEYAARSGGKQEKYAGGKDVDTVAWHIDNAGSSSHPVGTKAPNGLGLYDMSGNVDEWCEDAYAEYSLFSAGAVPNPAQGGAYRAIRGGAWTGALRGLRTTARFSIDHDAGMAIIGFRLVRNH
jgi:formylglycine-generating enzyme required for sulfatase activity